MSSVDKKGKLAKSVSAIAFAVSVLASQASNATAQSLVFSHLVNAIGVNVSNVSPAGNEDNEQGDANGYDSTNGDDTNGISTNCEDTEEVVPLLGDAADFNIFALENVTVRKADCNGYFAAGGNADIPDGYSTSGYAIVGGEVVSGSFDNGTLTPDEAGIDFSAAFAELRAVSATAARITPNGTIKKGMWDADIVFEGTDSRLNVFTISADEFNAMRTSSILSMHINVPDGSAVVINITGHTSDEDDTVDLGVNAGAYYANHFVSNGTASNAFILFNVTDAKRVIVKSSMGSLLAPNSDVVSYDEGGYPHFEGQIICRSYTGVNGFGSITFEANEEFTDRIAQLLSSDIADESAAEEADFAEDEIPEDKGLVSDTATAADNDDVSVDTEEPNDRNDSEAPSEEIIPDTDTAADDEITAENADETDEMAEAEASSDGTDTAPEGEIQAEEAADEVQNAIFTETETETLLSFTEPAYDTDEEAAFADDPADSIPIIIAPRRSYRLDRYLR